MNRRWCGAKGTHAHARAHSKTHTLTHIRIDKMVGEGRVAAGGWRLAAGGWRLAHAPHLGNRPHNTRGGEGKDG